MKAKPRAKNEGEREEGASGEESGSISCSFSWDKLIEMKNNKIQFLAGDGYKRLQIVEADEKTKSIHMICELGKITWPLRFDKLEEVHHKVHTGEVALIPYEMDRLVPTWGNFVTGLLRHLGCDKH
jgi:hypothetical protein